MENNKNITPPKDESPKDKETKKIESAKDNTVETHKNKPEKSRGREVANDSLTESSISTDAVDFEDSSFLEENKHAGKSTDVKKSEDEADDVDEYEKNFIDREIAKAEEEYELSEEEAMDKVIKEIAEQPFEVAMNNLEVSKDNLIRAASGVFSSKGYFEQEFSLPFGGNITMRSKTVNDYVDYTEYVRRLLLDPISQKEFDTFTQLRNMAYAVVVIDGDDLSQMDIEDKFQMLRNTSEVKITAIINLTKEFWRTTHLLLHPGLVDFLVSIPEE